MFKKPEEVLNYWISKLNEGEMEDVIALYHPEAILVPTFSERILDTPEGIRDYFAKQKHRKELRVHERMLLVQEMGENLHCVSGTYGWRFMLEGELRNVEARFSYVVDLMKNNPILHHHSSQIPLRL